MDLTSTTRKKHMNVGAIAGLATSMAESRLGQAVAIALLKKALAIQADSAAALLSALPTPNNLPAHLGQNIDTTA